jgi:transmembrane sensor
MQSAWETSERLRASPPQLEAAELTPLEVWAKRRGAVGGLIAACLIGGVFAIGWLSSRDIDLYRTGVGERKTVHLADGSVVQLNTASTIEVALRKSHRDIRLVRGEAQFQVAHDAERPFFVNAASARLRAVGTAFDVRLRDQAVVELTVTQGVVAVVSTAAHGGPAPHISAGGGAVIDGGAVAPTALGGEAVRQRTAWQQGVIEFKGETLAQVVDEFNRYQVHPIVIGDARLENIRVGGRFQVDEADKFLTAISSTFPIDVTHTSDGGVLLTIRQAKYSAPG